MLNRPGVDIEETAIDSQKSAIGSKLQACGREVVISPTYLSLLPQVPDAQATSATGCKKQRPGGLKSQIIGPIPVVQQVFRVFPCGEQTSIDK